MASLAMSTRLPLAVAPVRRPFHAKASGSSKQPRARPVLRRAEGPLREFKEDTGEVSTSSDSSGSGSGGEEVSQAQQALYADEKPEASCAQCAPEKKAAPLAALLQRELFRCTPTAVSRLPSRPPARALPQPPRDTMSPEMKERLRREYYGLGGSPNKPMSGNYFLNIILVISLLAGGWVRGWGWGRRAMLEAVYGFVNVTLV